MSKTIEQISQELDDKIPRDIISLRDGGGGRKLSYLEGWYVIDRLNKIFGPLGWSKTIEDVRQVVNTTNRGEFPAYLVKVKLEVKLGHGDTFQYAEKEAYGYGCDKSGLNAHELAIKEAVTDALKVAAKDLGMSMGLALYDKTQENVSDGDESESSNVVNDRQSAPQPTIKASTPAPLAKTPKTLEQRETVEEAIRSYVNVAKAQKKLTTDDFKKYLKTEYVADRLADLDIKQMQDTLIYLTDLTK